jgi:MtrB/PioB family decaheme-associated outer membrane protein
VLSDVAAESTAFDYERTQLKLRGEYRLGRQLRVHLGYDGRRFERSDQARRRTDTDRVWTRFMSRFSDDADLELELYGETRDGSEYAEPPTTGLPQNPLMRKYNLADRERRGALLRTTLFLSDTADLGLEIEAGRDDYEDTVIGLERTEWRRYGGDFSWLLSRSATLYASAFEERLESRQSNSQTLSAPDWRATSTDRFRTATLGVDLPRLIGAVDMKLELSSAESQGEIANDTSGRRTAFPDLESSRDTVRLGFSYPVNPALRVGFDWLRERYEESNWALQGIGPTTVPNLLALGAEPYDYDVNVFYVSVRWARPPAGLE